MLIVLSLLCIRPEIEVPATVAPLSRLLPELGQRANMKLVAGANVRHDVVGLASPKRPVRELMDGIAEAVNATWEKSGDQWVLTRTKTQEEEDVATDVAFRLKRLESALGHVKLNEPFTDTHALSLAVRRKEALTKDPQRVLSDDIRALDASSPTGRLGRRLLDSIRPSTIAKLPLNATTVFSSQPTARQRKLELPDIGELYRGFAEEQNRYAAAVANLEGSPPQRFDHAFDNHYPAPKPPAVVIVTIEPNLSGGVRARVKLADSEGKHLLVTDISPTAPPDTRPTETERGTPTVELNPETAAQTRQSYEWPPAVWERVEQPEVHEPLAPYLRECLGVWANFKQRPVIALLSDLMLGMPFPQKQPLAVGQALLQWQHKIDVSEARVLVRPQQPALVRATRVNRSALGQFFRQTRRDGVSTLKGLQLLWAKTDELQEYCVRQYAGDILLHRVNWDTTGLARLIALAGPEQRSTLERTGKLSCIDMTAAQREWLQKMVFDRRFFNQPTEWTPGVTDNIHDSLLSEPTVAYASGLPSDLTLVLTIESGPGAIVGSPEKGWSIQTFDEVATQRIDMGVPAPTHLYRIGQVRRYTAKLTLNSIQGFEFAASDVSEMTRVGVPYEQLDAALRDRITARSAELRKQYGIPPR